MNLALSKTFFPVSETNSKHYLLLFLLWPFLAFITAILNYSQKESRRVVYIFLIYYGFVMVTSPGIDSFTATLRFYDYALLPFSDFFKMVGGLYSDSTLDIVQPLITFLISRFTTYPGFLFAAFAALFGWFYIKSINQLHNHYIKNPGINAQIHLAFFALIIPVTMINGFRMYTAAWIYFYGAYFAILNKDARYLLFAVLSSFVHFSYILASIVLIIYFFAGNRNVIYLPLAVASFFVPQLFAPLIQSFSQRLSGGFEARYEDYSSEYYIQAVQEGYANAAWFMSLFNALVFYYLLFAIMFIKVRFGNLMQGKEERNLYSFLLLFLSYVNFGKVIPTLGGRFQTIFLLFATLYVFMYFLKLPGKKIHLLTLIGLFPMLLYIAVRFRQGADTINAWIFAPGMGVPLLAPGLSLAELIFH